MQGYEAVCDQLERRADRSAAAALLIISTPGGDPDAGFRIARALQHTYAEGFEALVPRYCKSAGTLVLLGAKKLYMADRSELGPLDIQIKKGDELFGRNSGLDINQAVEFLKGEALTSFNAYMHKLVRQGLSTKIAADIAVKLVNGIFHPIAAQIEPLRLAEMQRATTITYTYGGKLAKEGKNVSQNGLEDLVGGYPSHGFVIDRKEARSIFKNVVAPTDWYVGVCEAFQKQYRTKINDLTATVVLETVEFSVQPEGESNEAGNESLGAAASSSRELHRTINGDGRAAGARPRRKPAPAKRVGASRPNGA